MIDAVIFDMDGTLVDTETVSQAAWKIVLKRFGLEGDTRALRRSFLGKSVVTNEEALAQVLGSRERARQAQLAHNALFDQNAPTDLHAKPHARETVLAVRAAGYRAAVATSSERDRGLPRLARFGLDTVFDSLTFGDEIVHGKPAPDIFLKAAESLGVVPAACVVVEDSPNGVRAASAAGMRVLMVPDMAEFDEESLALCDAVLDSLADVPAAVESLSGRSTSR